MTCDHRDEVVALMHPHDTEMDLSIANALYFAARGRGLAITSEGAEPSKYSTTARVLLSGLGADELFGGYSRHGVAFSRGGYPELIEELQLDVSRLGKRNLGRDDRVMSHWGREVRFPFLDERLVKWAIEVPAWEKCDFHTSPSPGGLDAEKRVLRILANTLGMVSVSKEKKRAVRSIPSDAVLRFVTDTGGHTDPIWRPHSQDAERESQRHHFHIAMKDKEVRPSRASAQGP
jgi:asparagine synthetase B (glutamine-hydrolysing)